MKEKRLTQKEVERIVLQRMASESQGPRTEEERRLAEERRKKINQAMEKERAAKK